jgi:ABC-2 type transport system permease protein
MEEASNASSPVSIVASLSYVFALLVAIQNPTASAARIATFLPPVSPMIVPLRAALGAIEPWEIGLAVVVNVARSGCCSSSAGGSTPGPCSRRAAG